MVNITQGDYGFNLNFTLADSDGATLDLTDNTGIIFRMRNTTGSQKTVEGNCTVFSVDGLCYYELADGDTDTIGTYEFEVEVSYAGKVVTAKSTTTIVIVEQLD